MIQEFKEIEGFNGRYIISNDGIIIAKASVDKLGRGKQASEIKQIFTKGYLMVRLSKDNIQKQYSVAELVLKHFSNQWFEGCLDQIFFLDYNGTNCSLENLKISEQPLSRFQKERLEVKTRKLIKESKPKSHQHHTLSSFPNAAIKQIVIKTKEPKKERIVKNIIRVTLEGRHADKVELIKELAILSDKYDIETINSDSIKFRKKVFKSTTNKTVSEKPIKNSLLKFPSPPLGFCTIPQFKGKYLINKEGKILRVNYNKVKKEWIYKELKYIDTGTSIKAVLSINGVSTTTRVAAIMLAIFARIKNTHSLRFSYVDGNYKNVSFDNIIFE